MAIGSHGTGRGGTVGDVRTGRSADLGKALSLLSVFVTASVATDPHKIARTRNRKVLSEQFYT